MNALASSPVTAEELLRLSHPGKQVELVRGKLVVREPPAAWHGGLSNRVAYRLTRFVDEHELGAVFGQDTGFQIAADPDTVRAPDGAFVQTERLADIPRRGYPRLAPDLAVEVLSPDDRPGEVLASARGSSPAYASSGCSTPRPGRSGCIAPTAASTCSERRTKSTARTCFPASGVRCRIS